jgi:hypothetical protein
VSLLPLTALPYIPAAFAPGDRVTHLTCSLMRDSSGLWTCKSCEPRGPINDSSIRRRFVEAVSLEVLGVPLMAPAPVPTDEPLPGRPVAEGENPFEVRPYLMAGDLGGVFQPLPGDGPWGIAQRASTPIAPNGPAAWTYEMSLTDSGRVWYRAHGLTVAYIPAEDPTDNETVAILAAAVLRLAFPETVSVLRLSNYR